MEETIMLECRTYTYSEFSELFHTNDTQSIKRRLDRWGVQYEAKGRGAGVTFHIQEIPDRFKLYCILDLDFSPQTDFEKLALFLYYLFNYDGFDGLPCEMMEARIKMDGLELTRQTISKYLDKLGKNNLLLRDSGNYHYYFAQKGTLIETTQEEYRQAWSEYWQAKDNGHSPWEAIYQMCRKYGGVAKKQAIIMLNGIYGKELDALNDMVCNRMEQMGSAAL